LQAEGQLPVDLALKNAKVYAYGDVMQAGLAIDGGKIVRIAKDANLPSASRETLTYRRLLERWI